MENELKVPAGVPTSADDVIKLWEQNKYPITVYIHSPFCETQCSYCIYKGCQYDEEAYKEYYDNYLPKAIKMYEKVITNIPINSWFFGGGTPSLMKPETMEKLFKSLPQLQFKRGEKVFEIHPAFWTVEQLDILVKYRFNTVLVGIQTFSEQILAEQNRPTYNVHRVGSLLTELKKRNINVGVDIIFFAEESKNSREALRKDLEILYMLRDKIDEISFMRIFKSPKENNLDMFEEIASSKIFNSKEYFCAHMEEDISKEQIQCRVDEFGGLKAIRLFKKTKLELADQNKFFSFPGSLDVNLERNVEMVCSTLGIGALGNTMDTFSNINNNIHYIEVNKNGEQTFFVKKTNFFDEARKLLDILEEGGEPPKGTTFLLTNSPRTEIGAQTIAAQVYVSVVPILQQWYNNYNMSEQDILSILNQNTLGEKTLKNYIDCLSNILGGK